MKDGEYLPQKPGMRRERGGEKPARHTDMGGVKTSGPESSSQQSQLYPKHPVHGAHNATEMD